MANILFDTYKNNFMIDGKHMFHTASDMVITTMCAYPSSKYAFTTLEMCFVLLFTMSMD